MGVPREKLTSESDQQHLVLEFIKTTLKELLMKKPHITGRTRQTNIATKLCPKLPQLTHLIKAWVVSFSTAAEIMSWICCIQPT